MSTQNIYKRVNDNIDKNALITKAHDTIDFWLSTTNLNNKQKEATRQEVLNLLKGIADDSLVYNQYGGFTDTSGRNLTNNSDPKKDYLGYGAGFLGNLIRHSDVIKEPEKWSRNNIAKYITQGIFDSDTPDLDMFKDLDYLDYTSNKERVKVFLPWLQNVYDNFNTLFPDATEEDKENWIKDYELAADALKDNELTKNELLALRKATGISDLSSWFSIDAEQPSETITNAATVSEPVEDVPTNTTVADNSYVKFNDIKINLLTQNSYDKNYVKDYSKFIDSQSSSNLIIYVDEVLKGNKSVKLSKMKGAPLPSDNRYLGNTEALNIILQSLLKRGAFNNYVDSAKDGQIYIKGTHNEDQHWAYVYDPINSQVIARDITEIPYFVTVKKHGGVLKAQSGIQVPTFKNPFVNTSNPFDLIAPQLFENSNYKEELLTSNPDNYKGLYQAPKYPEGWYESIWNAITWDNEFLKHYQDDNGQWQFKPRQEHAVNTKDPRYYIPENYKGTTDGYEPGKYQSVEELEKLPYYKAYRDRFFADDDLAIEILNNYWNNRGTKTPDPELAKYRDANGNWTDLDAARTRYEQLMFDHKLGPAHDVKFASTYYIDGQNGYYKEIPKGYRAEEKFILDDTGLVRKYKLIKDDGTSTNPQNPQDPNDLDDPSKIKINPEVIERFPNRQQQSIKSPFGERLASIIARASKLPLAFNTNANIAKTVIKGLSPALLNSPNFFLPIYDRYNYEQFLANQAANVHNAANKGNVSDYRLGQRGQYQGELATLDLEGKGKLASDEQLQNSAEKSVANDEKYMLAKSDTANKNGQLIADYNQKKAYTEAQKLQKNYESLDNTINYALYELDKDYTDKKEMHDYLAKDLATKMATNFRRNAMMAPQYAYQQYMRDSNNGPLENWDDYKNYINYSMLVDDMASQMYTSNLAKLSGINYNSGYSDDSYKNLLKTNWKNINDIIQYT